MDLMLHTAGYMQAFLGDGTSSATYNLNGAGLTSVGLWNISAVVVTDGISLRGILNKGTEASVDISAQNDGLANSHAFKIGAYSTAYFNGQIPLVLVEDRAMSSRELIGNGNCSSASTASASRLQRECGTMGTIAWQMWQERKICVTGYRSFCTE